MSQKTVEANLSRIYRKLGIRSRAELGIRLAAAEAKRALNSANRPVAPRQPRDRESRG